MQPLDVKLKAVGIGLCHGQGVWAGIERRHAGRWPRVFQGESDGPAAGTHVDYIARGAFGKQFQRPVHQRLRVWPRHQHVRRDMQREAVEFFFPDEKAKGSPLARRWRRAITRSI